MNLSKLNRLVLTSLSAIGLFFSVSICATAAQIDTLSVVDNTIYASVSGESSTFFAAEYEEAVLVDVFFKDISDGEVELPIGTAGEYKLFLWDKESLAPVSGSYKLLGDKAYATGSDEPLPEYEFSSYSFNQEDNVMIVSKIDSDSITGFKAGTEITYPLSKNVSVMGLSQAIEDVVPGSVVLLGTTKNGSCGAIELLASTGIPVSITTFESAFGIYTPADGSSKYQNIVTELISKSSSKITTKHVLNENGDKALLEFEAPNKENCYRVGIAMDGNTPVISCSKKKISTFPSIFESTADYHNYLYLRYNTETSKIKELVYYCVPKDFFVDTDGGDYSPIFGLKPIVIIQ